MSNDTIRQGFKKRIYLLYSVIHYDAVVDQSENGTFASNDANVLNAVEALVKELHKKHRFVNLSGFKLTCYVYGVSKRIERTERCRPPCERDRPRTIWGDFLINL